MQTLWNLWKQGMMITSAGDSIGFKQIAQSWVAGRCQKSWPRPTPRREAPASACFAKTQEHAEA